jgi:hypothetical protein
MAMAQNAAAAKRGIIGIRGVIRVVNATRDYPATESTTT